MRLRNIPRAGEVLEACEEVVKHPAAQHGNWKDIFKNTNPIHIEIGMGKGQFLLKLALQNPNINYVGVERYSSVLLRAVEKYKDLREQNGAPGNLRFICMDATELADVFSTSEVDKIYLNFSDPWPKTKHARRRLTSKEYFARYDKVLAADGSVEFKTDNRGLFDFSMEQLEESSVWRAVEHTFDLHRNPNMNAGNVMTEYEEKFSGQGNPICKLIAKRKSQDEGCI